MWCTSVLRTQPNLNLETFSRWFLDDVYKSVKRLRLSSPRLPAGGLLRSEQQNAQGEKNVTSALSAIGRLSYYHACHRTWQILNHTEIGVSVAYCLSWSKHVFHLVCHTFIWPIMLLLESQSRHCCCLSPTEFVFCGIYLKGSYHGHFQIFFYDSFLWSTFNLKRGLFGQKKNP